MFRVDALIIGAQKAGTTSLYQYVKGHPGVEFSRVKEVPFFGDPGVYGRGIAHFHSFFRGDHGAGLKMSADVHLLASGDAPRQVFSYNPQMRMIAVLRHPASRAWSAYCYAKSKGWESPGTSFEEAMALEAERVQSGKVREVRDLAYLRNGLYWQHLSNWVSVFPRDSILLLTADELRTQTHSCLARVWRFLGLEEWFPASAGKEFNRTGRARFQVINSVLYRRDSAIRQTVGRVIPSGLRVWIRSEVFSRLAAWNTVPAATAQMPPATRDLLEAYYRDDLERLERDFGVRFADRPMDVDG